jgi:hypothetical protein
MNKETVANYDIMKNVLGKDERDMVLHINMWSLISGASSATDGTCCSAQGIISDLRHDSSSKADGTRHQIMMKPESTPDSAKPFNCM